VTQDLDLASKQAAQAGHARIPRRGHLADPIAQTLCRSLLRWSFQARATLPTEEARGRKRDAETKPLGKSGSSGQRDPEHVPRLEI
jgi:hypothetical protein